MDGKNLKLELEYDRVVSLWQKLCEYHTSLYEFTLEEYALLLESKIDELDELLVRKQEVIDQISVIDQARQSMITELNQESNDIKNVTDLLNYFKELEAKKSDKYLSKFNSLLIEIIERVQDQNRKNQIFLNRAIGSLREIRLSFQGKKTLTTYNSQGTTNRSVVR
jgi:flagellar biosynthesis/type III secretory pathway chaperone